MNNKIMFFYTKPQQMEFRNSNNKNRRKLATRATIGGIVKDNQLIIASTICGINDNFSKTIGRKLVTEKLEANPSMVITMTEEQMNKPLKTFIEVCVGLCSNVLRLPLNEKKPRKKQLEENN